ISTAASRILNRRLQDQAIFGQAIDKRVLHDRVQPGFSVQIEDYLPAGPIGPEWLNCKCTPQGRRAVVVQTSIPPDAKRLFNRNLPLNYRIGSEERTQCGGGPSRGCDRGDAHQLHRDDPPAAGELVRAGLGVVSARVRDAPDPLPTTKNRASAPPPGVVEGFGMRRLGRRITSAAQQYTR